MLTNKEDQLKRWAEHFEELLNGPAPEDTPEILPAESPLHVNCDKPTRQEVRRAILALKNGKAMAGPDEIPEEALKAAPDTSFNGNDLGGGRGPGYLEGRLPCQVTQDRRPK